jgi:hypothetical protein
MYTRAPAHGGGGAQGEAEQRQTGAQQGSSQAGAVTS